MLFEKNEVQETSTTQNSFDAPAIDFSKVSNKELLFRMEVLAKNERKLLHVTLQHIHEIESRKLFISAGFNSLYQYLTQALGYSDGAAYERVQASRLFEKAPEISAQIEKGELNLSRLSKIEKAIKDEKKNGLLKSIAEEKEVTQKLLLAAKNKTLFETKQIIAEILDQPVAKPETKINPQKDKSVRIEFTLTAEEFEILKKAQDIMSHSVPERKFDKAVLFLANFYVGKKMGKTIGKTREKNTEKKPQEEKNHGTPSVEQKSEEGRNTKNPDSGKHRVEKRKHISIKTKRELFQRSGHCCEYKDPKTKVRCTSTYQLQVDHRVPWSITQDDSIENLRVLCFQHNQSEAKRWNLNQKN